MSGKRSSRAQVIELLEQGKTYRETADTLELSYQSVYQYARSAGIAQRRTEEKRKAKRAQELEQQQENIASRKRLYELLQRYRRGELVPDPVTSLEDAAITLEDVFAFHGSPPDVTPELDWTAPLTAAERDVFDKLDGLMAIRESKRPEPDAVELAQRKYAEVERQLAELVKVLQVQRRARDAEPPAVPEAPIDQDDYLRGRLLEELRDILRDKALQKALREQEEREGEGAESRRESRPAHLQRF
jgi:hypothetical protein